MCSLTYFFLILLKKIIYIAISIINKFIKHIKLNNLCRNIKYLDLPLNFSTYVFIYH